ncbi:hypothetical protein BAUCODRAFT_65065, partial [Baudoinia panamericana UAMH 10762]
MEFWARILGGAQPAKRPSTERSISASDPQTRLVRYKRCFRAIHDLCNNTSRDPANDGPLFHQLTQALDRLVALTREESKAPVANHLCLQYAANAQIYTVIGRAAIVSQDEHIVRSAVSFFAALVDSEEDDFLLNRQFAKSLIRLATKVLEGGEIVVVRETEIAILEVLFSISAKIRLQPESLLPVWFQSTVKPGLEDIFVREKRSFVGITQKADFPLCYLFIDRVHHEGRVGDFARTGLLHIFEATGRSTALEEWIVSSDLPTLLASSLGALYSQLSRELSIVHPDTQIPAVLALSDYTTSHARATAESAFSEEHQAHMKTFLSYLMFWQDVVDYCKSADVKQTLLDHFQILFLQQLLYPSILQSSDKDAGSSVAVLTYMTTLLDVLDQPDLVHMILTYLLPSKQHAEEQSPSPAIRKRPSMPPRSPTALKRRQSLMLITAPRNPTDAVEPALFDLADFILNSLRSSSSQTVFAALKLTTTLVVRDAQYALGPLLRVQRRRQSGVRPTLGTFEVETEQYLDVVSRLHDGNMPEDAYASLCDDLRYSMDVQPSQKVSVGGQMDDTGLHYQVLREDDAVMHNLTTYLRTFFTNDVDVNLALTAAIASVATCTNLRLADGWIGYQRMPVQTSQRGENAPRAWQAYLDDEEKEAWSCLRKALTHPTLSPNDTPIVLRILQSLVAEWDYLANTVPDFAQLLAQRQSMLQ